jgi:hypothetical protein
MRFGDVAAILGLGLIAVSTCSAAAAARRAQPRGPARTRPASRRGRAAVGGAAQHLARQVAQILAGAIAQAGRRDARRHVGDRLAA